MEKAPAKTIFYYLGVMLSRKACEVRLCFIDVSISAQSQVRVKIFFDSQLMWDEFFKLLVKNMICSTGDIEKISKWPGFDIEEKSQLLQELSEITGREIKYLIRILNHIKLACDASGNIKAKAYLYFCYY